MGLRDVNILLGLITAPFIAGARQAQAASAGLATNITRDATRGSRSAAVLGSSFGTVGLVAGAAGAAMVSAAADFDQGMSNVKATGSDATKNIGALRQAAIDAGNATKYSATEAAGGVEALAKAGVASSDILGGGLSGALDLAAAGNLDVAGSAEAAASAMNQFGLQGKDVPHIADLLAAGAGKAQGEVSDMAMALNQAGLIAHGAGASIEETTGTLAAFASAGLIGSDAGTSFKTMLQRLQAPSNESAVLMKRLGISAYDTQGNFVGLASVAGQLQKAFEGKSDAERSAALATIFGSDAVRAANVLYEQGEGGIRKWTKAVDDSGYATDTAKTKMDNLKGDLETLKGTFETLLIQKGEGSQGPLRTTVRDANSLLTLFNKIENTPFGKTILDSAVRAINPASLVSGTIHDTKDLYEQFRTSRVASRSGVEAKVVTKFETLGAEASARKITAVARAAHLTPKQVRSVLQLLNWSPRKIDAVVDSLWRTKRNATVRSTLQVNQWETTKIDKVTEALRTAKSERHVKAILTKQGFTTDDIEQVLDVLAAVNKSNPRPKMEVVDKASKTTGTLQTELDRFAKTKAKPTMDINDQASSGLDRIKGKVDDLHDKTITVTTVEKTVQERAGGGAIQRFADGGFPRVWGAVSGPGTDTSDSINARLSDGEHVLTASDVRKMGGQDAVYSFRAAVQSGDFQFANGGQVRSWTPAFVGGGAVASSAPANAGPLTLHLKSGALTIRGGRAYIEGIAEVVAAEHVKAVQHHRTQAHNRRNLT